MMTRDDAVNEVFKCRHETEYGTNAFMPFGTYGEGYEQCIICGKVICTEPQEESSRDAAGYPVY